VTRPDGKTLSFEVDAFRKFCLLNGYDDIGLSLQPAPTRSGNSKPSAASNSLGCSRNNT